MSSRRICQTGPRQRGLASSLNARIEESRRAPGFDGEKLLRRPVQSETARSLDFQTGLNRYAALPCRRNAAGS